jgi:hypothetical protein
MFELRAACSIQLNFEGRGFNSGEKKPFEPYHRQEAVCLYPISCHITEWDNGLVFRWVYHKQFFNQPMIEILNECYFELMDKVVSSPGENIQSLLPSSIFQQ